MQSIRGIGYKLKSKNYARARVGVVGSINGHATLSMDQTVIINFTTKSMMLVLMLSLPSILVATFIGLIISLMQALTQIQEQTLSFTAKLIALTAVLLLTAHWMGGQLIQFTQSLFEIFPRLVR